VCNIETALTKLHCLRLAPFLEHYQLVLQLAAYVTTCDYKH